MKKVGEELQPIHQARPRVVEKRSIDGKDPAFLHSR
jgi:hypothetical protein